jgi:hypothetical protein
LERRRWLARFAKLTPGRRTGKQNAGAKPGGRVRISGIRASGYSGGGSSIRLICVTGYHHMATPNYSFEKRRKEMERKSKKQQKAERKLEGNSKPSEETTPETTPSDN